MPDSESCGGMSTYLPWTAVCCQSHLWFRPAPRVPKQNVQSMSKNIQGQPLTRQAENQTERKIDHIAYFYVSIYIVHSFGRSISGLTHFDPTA